SRAAGGVARADSGIAFPEPLSLMAMELRIERAVAGGRMLARHDGGIVLVAGAIPGELVRARVERTAKHVSFARVEEVIEASPHRREPVCNPSCGGMDYAHIEYDAQLDCKREIVR